MTNACSAVEPLFRPDLAPLAESTHYLSRREPINQVRRTQHPKVGHGVSMPIIGTDFKRWGTSTE
jgi:hypothetical protein